MMLTFFLLKKLRSFVILNKNAISGSWIKAYKWRQKLLWMGTHSCILYIYIYYIYIYSIYIIYIIDVDR